MDEKIKERVRFLRLADELIRNYVDDEDLHELWISYAIPDGEIGDKTTDEELAWLADDENFRDIIAEFRGIMKRAANHHDFIAGGVGC